jgi:predicted nucleic acid-binding protein
MIDKARITFDTNVLIYAAIADASPRHQIAERLLARAAQVNCVLVLQSLAEFVWVSTRKAYLSMDAAATMVGTWLDIYPSVQATPETVRAALVAVRRHHLGFWDAMLWAVAREAGCRYLLSENFQAGRTLEGVTFVNPFAPGGLPEEVERALGDR